VPSPPAPDPAPGSDPPGSDRPGSKSPGSDAPAGQPDPPFVSRGGLKLDAAFDRFGRTLGLDPAGLVCADLGCSTGGFTDCLLRRGAARVYAVDTAYGELAWRLRQDPRVVVMERTSALHADAPEPCGLVVIDLGWTRQARAIPAALRWLTPGGTGRVVTLIKPHYESPGALRGGKRGRLTDDEALAVAQRVVAEDLPALGVRVLGWMVSPIRGGKGGNLEYLAVLAPAGTPQPDTTPA